MEKSAKKRNGMIGLLKFLFSIIIVIYHNEKLLIGYNHFTVARVGYILVDFFFMVSGYYLYSSILKIKDSKRTNIYKENMKLLKKKISTFLPYTIIIGIASGILLYFSRKASITEVIMSIFNIFLVDMSGLSGFSINCATWYLSAMLISFFILIPIIYKNKDRYVYYIAPIIILFGLGYLYKSSPTLNLYINGWNGYLYKGLIRALVDINIGILIYNIVPTIIVKVKTKCQKIFVLIAEIILYAMLFYLIFIYGVEGILDYLMLIVIAVAIVFTFVDQNISRKLDTPFINYLERISLPIYINQFFFINLFIIIGEKYKHSFLLYSILCTVSIIVFSIAEEFIIQKLKKINK